jgi:hypothetical protein
MSRRVRGDSYLAMNERMTVQHMNKKKKDYDNDNDDDDNDDDDDDDDDDDRLEIFLCNLVLFKDASHWSLLASNTRVINE